MTLRNVIPQIAIATACREGSSVGDAWLLDDDRQRPESGGGLVFTFGNSLREARATTSPTLSPSARTELIQWASDIESIAAWREPEWRAPYPHYPDTVLKATARKLLYECGARDRNLDRFFKVSEWRW